MSPTHLSPTYQALFAKFGPAVGIEGAAPLLTYPNGTAARAAIYRGSFPVPVRHLGNKLLVSTAAIAAFLDGELPDLPAATRAPARPPQPGKRGRGRPRKVAVQAEGGAA